MNKAALLGVAAGLAALLLVLMGTGTQKASADAGPHMATGADATPDKCAGCHRIHTGKNDYLLKDAGTIEEFCYSCHGDGGPGSDLAVTEGRYYGFGSGEPYGGKLTYGALRGGGFESALIDTDDPTPDVIGTLATGQPTQSWHTIDGTAGTMWGSGAIGSGAGALNSLECTSCHDPHGNGQFRILRPIPMGSGVGTGVTVTDQADPKNYGVTNYLYMGADVSLTQISSWCSTCHARYRATNSPPVNSGDAIFTFRHRSDGSSNRACITCHASHGTNALMTGTYSSTMEWPDGSTGTGTTDNNNSRLLKMNNRGICIKCHTDK